MISSYVMSDCTGEPKWNSLSALLFLCLHDVHMADMMKTMRITASVFLFFMVVSFLFYFIN